MAVERLPLASVRTFAVVARLLSITRAAEELNVTPSAVSHQIRILEQYLGTSLFRRERNRIRLTPSGQQYMAQVSEALLVLTRATSAIKAAKGQQTLRICAPPSLAGLWLIERMGRFMKAHPDIVLTLTATASPEPPPLLQGAFDVAFWYGGGTVPGLSVDALGPNFVFPICKPAFIKGDHALRAPSDLARCTLVDSTDEAYYQYKEPRQPGWHAWLHAAGLPELTARKHLDFTPRLLMHMAVVAGLGVGISRSLLAVDSLRRREVVVPFGPAVPQSITYNLVYATHAGKRKDVATFRDWMLAEAQSSAKKLDKIVKRHLRK